MHLPLGNHGRETQQQQQEAREARKLFRENVRADWDFPPLPAYRAVTSGTQLGNNPDTIAGFRIHGGVAESSIDQIVPELMDWQEREYGSSDTEEDVSDAENTVAREQAYATKQSVEYIFDSPHSVGEELKERRQVRRMKRQRVLTEEMQWNDGLRHFIDRRDLWTGAKTRSAASLIPNTDSAHSGLRSSATTPSPRSSTSVATDATDPSRPSTAMTTPDPASIPTLQPLPPEMVTPRMSRVLSAHPIRKKIGPNMYSEIYSKIITQSRTPSVPINLLDLTRALVSGWKADGEWPPRPNVPEPSVGRRRAGIREGVKAAARALKITNNEVVVPQDGKKKKAG